MSFTVLETGTNIPQSIDPSLSLPATMKRNCRTHSSADASSILSHFPSPSSWRRLEVHHGGVRETLIQEAIARFYWLRNLPDLRKAPSTSELIDWIGALVKGGVSESELSDRVPYLGSLIKKEQDLETLARFQKRRGRS